MHHLSPIERSLRELYDLGSDRMWFALAVIMGLFLASWLGQLALDVLMIVPEGGTGF